MNWKRFAVFLIVIMGILLFPLINGKQVQSTPVTTDETENEEKKDEDIGDDLPEVQEPEVNEAIFPKTITVIDVGETVPVNIRQQPTGDSKSLGVVYGNLMHVDVVKHLDSGYTEVSTWDYKSMKSISGFVPTKYIKEIELDEKYGVVVKISEQKVYIYKDDDIHKTFSCSTGLDENNYYTPKGFYRIGDRGGSFYSPKYKQGAYNWVRFNYNYLFHSVPFDENENLIPEEMDKLGQKASHGCIRIPMEDSKWFYDNIPRGTPVIITD